MTATHDRREVPPLFRSSARAIRFWCVAALALAALAPHQVHGELPPVPAPEAPLDRTHPLVGQIVSSDGQLSTRQFADRIKASDFVLLGEKHDNPDHHRLQAWVIEAIVAQGKRPAIAMEMLDGDQAEALIAYRRKAGADAAGLGAAVGWEKRGWPDWKMYAPIAEVALRADLPIIPADLTRAAIRDIGRGGVEALGPAAALEKSPRYDAQQSASLADELRTSHCNQLPEASLPRMMDVQWARDANMARVLRTAERSSVLIAGAGHIRNDRAVPWHLQAKEAGTVLSVAFVEVQPRRDDPAAYTQSGLFDVLWFTARVDDEDPCVKFRDSLRRVRQP